MPLIEVKMLGNLILKQITVHPLHIRHLNRLSLSAFGTSKSMALGLIKRFRPRRMVTQGQPSPAVALPDVPRGQGLPCPLHDILWSVPKAECGVTEGGAVQSISTFITDISERIKPVIGAGQQYWSGGSSVATEALNDANATAIVKASPIAVFTDQNQDCRSVVKEFVDMCGRWEQNSNDSFELTSKLNAMIECLANEYSFDLAIGLQQEAIQALNNLAMRNNEPNITRLINQCLILLGQINEPSRDGIRILSLDGGGIRGRVAIRILREIQQVSGAGNIMDSFDYICGTSSGALIAAFVVALGYDLDKIDDLYRNYGKVLFDQSTLDSINNLLRMQSFYDTSSMERLLRSFFNDITLLDCGDDTTKPRLAIVSCSPSNGELRPFVFRNYKILGIKSKLAGTCKGSIFDAIRASTAVPLLYSPVNVQSQEFVDGGLGANNPVWVAVHEARRLWPDKPMHCIISLGTGIYNGGRRTRSEQEAKKDTSSGLSLLNALPQVMNLATNTIVPHLIADDMLCEGTYIRFNPPISNPITLNEHREQFVDTLLLDTQSYLDRNPAKVQYAAWRLKRHRSLKLRLRSTMQRLWTSN